MITLNNKIALIVGASSEPGIGSAIAKIFIEAGAKVVISGRRKDALEEIANNIGCTFIAADFTNDQEVKNLIGEVVSTHGSLDIAVNAVGIYNPVPIAEMTREHLLEYTNLHFISPTLFIKESAAVMKDGGSIITLSSLTVELTNTGLGGYAGAKAATDKIVQIAAYEYGPQGIRVNSLSPGLVETEMTEALFTNPNMVSAFIKETPVGRMPSLDDVAHAALWLASDQCISTGDNIRVSGGGHLRRLPTMEELMGE